MTHRNHVRRAVTLLDGLWDFSYLGEVDRDAVDVAALTWTDRVPVPGCYDALPAYAGVRGLAAYRTTVQLQDDTPHRLVFEAVNLWCRVIADGTEIRQHAGGFTRFTADLPRGAGEVELVVLVDNRFGPHTPLHPSYADWYSYGGLVRSVELHRLGEVWVDGLRAVPTLDPPGVDLALSWAGTGASTTAELAVLWNGEQVLAEQVALDGSTGSLTRRLELPGAAPWSPQSPVLHRLEVRLADDDMVQRVGLRTFGVDGSRLVLNGEPVKLVGYGRHDLHPQFGPALPLAQLVVDAQLVVRSGANFVRGAHYPQDPRWLDLCDEMGLLVWCEALGWQQQPDDLDEAYLRAYEQHLDEMVAAAAEHPSVVLWGLLNEGPTRHSRVRPAYQRLIGRLRELDPTRPVTYASLNGLHDKCADLVDVVSVNAYPGWYFGYLDDVRGHLDEIAQALDDAVGTQRPLILSEIGADALPGWRDDPPERWGEDYQSQLLESVVDHLFFKGDRWSGLSVWVLHDFRTARVPERIVLRPAGVNRKGVTDELRRPKQAYRMLSRLFPDVTGRATRSG